MVELKLEMLNHSLPILYGTMNPFHPANLLRYVKRVEGKNQLRIQCLSVYVNVESLRMKMESYHHL